jgi:hypothetical protein
MVFEVGNQESNGAAEEMLALGQLIAEQDFVGHREHGLVMRVYVWIPRCELGRQFKSVHGGFPVK